MSTQYFIDSNNNYLGGFDGATGKVPQGATEVPFPPKDARSIWNGSTWNDPVLTLPEKEEKLGVTDDSRIAAMWAFLAYGEKTQMDDLKLKEAQAKQ